MIRQNWRTAGFWRWWWQTRVPADAKVVAAVLLGALFLLGGYVASGHLSGTSTADAAQSYVLQTTISKVVTVKEHGRTVVKRVPVVVRRTIVRSKTAFATVVDTHVVTAPGGTKYVTRKVVRYVPVVHKRTVRVNGKTKTVTETKLVPTVKTETAVVTNQQTVTNQNTVLVDRPVTTVESHTVTLPPDTVTQTQTQTQTQTETVTETETVTTTVTEPAVTVTVTLPLG